MTTSSVILKHGSMILGDCVSILSTLPDGTADLIFADPPYNLSGKSMSWEGKEMGGDWYKINEHWDVMSDKEYAGFTEDWLSQSQRVLRESGSIYVCCTLHNLAILMSTMQMLGLKCNNVITWHKSNSMPSMTRRNFTHSTEFILYFVKGKGWTFNYDDLKRLNPERRLDGEPKQMRDLWTLPLCQGKERLRGPDGRALHPTQKPEALLERILTASSLPGQLVLDPFVGSGTTCKVAVNLQRRFLGIERDPDYFAAALARVRTAERVCA